MEEGKSNGIDVPKMIFQDNQHQDDDTMSVYSATNRDSSHSSEDGMVIGAAENRRVTISRIIMFAVFLLAAAGFGALTWFYTTGQEQQNFESTVSQQGTKESD